MDDKGRCNSIYTHWRSCSSLCLQQDRQWATVKQASTREQKQSPNGRNPIEVSKIASKTLSTESDPNNQLSWTSCSILASKNKVRHSKISNSRGTSCWPSRRRWPTTWDKPTGLSTLRVSLNCWQMSSCRGKPAFRHRTISQGMHSTRLTPKYSSSRKKQRWFSYSLHYQKSQIHNHRTQNFQSDSYKWKCGTKVMRRGYWLNQALWISDSQTAAS